MGYFYSYSKKVMDPAPRGLGIPVVTLLLEVNEYKYLNADVSWNIFLCLFFGQWWSSDFVSRVGRMPSLRWKTTLPQANHVWWSRWANKFSIKMSLPIFNQNVSGNFQSKCLWQFSIKCSIKVSPASRRVKVFAPPHPGLGQGGRHPCLCTSARKSQLCHRGLEPQAGLPALKYGSAVGKSQM